MRHYSVIDLFLGFLGKQLRRMLLLLLATNVSNEFWNVFITHWTKCPTNTKVSRSYNRADTCCDQPTISDSINNVKWCGITFTPFQRQHWNLICRVRFRPIMSDWFSKSYFCFTMYFCIFLTARRDLYLITDLPFIGKRLNTKLISYSYSYNVKAYIWSIIFKFSKKEKIIKIVLTSDSIDVSIFKKIYHIQYIIVKMYTPT